MPWTPKQHRLFMAAAHNPAIAASHHMDPEKAREMAGEGIKDATTHAVRKKTLVKHLRGGGSGGIGGGGTGSVGSM
jgi:hypothetical protein